MPRRLSLSYSFSQPTTVSHSSHRHPRCSVKKPEKQDRRRCDDAHQLPDQQHMHAHLHELPRRLELVAASSRPQLNNHVVDKNKTRNRRAAAKAGRQGRWEVSDRANRSGPRNATRPHTPFFSPLSKLDPNLRSTCTQLSKKGFAQSPRVYVAAIPGQLAT